MRLLIPAAAIIFLLLLLLLNTAEGNHLEASCSKIVEQDFNLKGGGRDKEEAVILDIQRWSRKTMMINRREEAAMAPSNKVGGIKNKDQTAVLKEEQSPELDSDMFDIAGMDYSPAKKKSPIHN
ncbi:hypothetical protein KSP39_PZI021076 [Platanthera zijinensis]|uniref:Uncharacterized protein n=1 Tax=Platanthera zijinensis TaxID=2320716 RepID=A0AAP0AYD6_9ASPA